MANSWDVARASAAKVLGDKAKIPEPKAPNKALDVAGKAFDAFDKSRDDIEAKLLDLQNSFGAVKNAFDQFGAIIEKSDFGLDKKNKDDAKKIADAQKILGDYIGEVDDAQSANVKMLGELDKHIILLSKYKPPTI